MSPFRCAWCSCHSACICEAQNAWPYIKSALRTLTNFLRANQICCASRHWYRYSPYLGLPFPIALEHISAGLTLQGR